MKSASNLLLSLVFLVWFLGSMIGLVVSAKDPAKQWLIPVIFGQYMLVFGLVGLIASLSEKKKRGWWLGAVCLLVGLTTAILGLAHHYGSPSTREAIISAIPALVGAVFLIGGGCGLWSETLYKKRLERIYTIPVTGTCVEHKVHRSSNGSRLICPVYEAYLNGETVRFCKESYSNVGYPAVGEQRTLYTDGEDLEFYLEPEGDGRQAIISIVIFGGLMAAGAVTLVFSLLL